MASASVFIDEQLILYLKELVRMASDIYSKQVGLPISNDTLYDAIIDGSTKADEHIDFIGRIIFHFLRKIYNIFLESDLDFSSISNEYELINKLHEDLHLPLDTDGLTTLRFQFQDARNKIKKRFEDTPKTKKEFPPKKIPIDGKPVPKKPLPKRTPSGKPQPPRSGDSKGSGSQQGRSKFFLRHDATIPFLVEYVNNLTDPDEVVQILQDLTSVKGQSVQTMLPSHQIAFYRGKLSFAKKLKEMIDLEYDEAFGILDDIRKGDGDAIQKALVASSAVAQAFEDLSEFSTPQKLFERGIEIADKAIDFLTSGTAMLSSGTTSYSFREEQKEQLGEMFGKIGEIAGTVVGTLGEALGAKTFAQMNDPYVEQVIKSKYEAITFLLDDFINGLERDIAYIRKSSEEFAGKREEIVDKGKKLKEYERDVYWTERLTDAEFQKRFPGVVRGSPYISFDTWASKKGKGLSGGSMDYTKEYLQMVNKSASKHGYSKPVPNEGKGKHKFTIDGVKFGDNSSMDYWLYRISYGDEFADKKRKAYLARSGKIRGNWRSDKLSPNNLARRVLWDADD